VEKDREDIQAHLSETQKQLASEEEKGKEQVQLLQEMMTASPPTPFAPPPSSVGDEGKENIIKFLGDELRASKEEVDTLRLSIKASEAHTEAAMEEERNSILQDVFAKLYAAFTDTVVWTCYSYLLPLSFYLFLSTSFAHIALINTHPMEHTYRSTGRHHPHIRRKK
jgi:maltodextrin utilization protein YvdJ